MIDTVHRIETPEGIELAVHPAGPVARGLAVGVDMLITGTLSTLVVGLLAIFGAMGFVLGMVFAFLLEWFYPVLFDVYGHGQTPGKRMFDVRVIHADGTPIGIGASILRNLLRVVDGLPVFYAFGLVSMMLTRDFQRLGDLAAGTLVVGVPPRKSVRAEPLAVAGVRTSPLPLRQDDQRAIMGYAERSGEISEERLVELSDLLEPLTTRRGVDGARELMRIANGLAGRS